MVQTPRNGGNNMYDREAERYENFMSYADMSRNYDRDIEFLMGDDDTIDDEDDMDDWDDDGEIPEDDDIDETWDDDEYDDDDDEDDDGHCAYFESDDDF